MDFFGIRPSWGYCSCGRFGTQDRSVTLPVWQAHVDSLRKSEYDFGTPEQVITGLGAINEHNAALAAPPGEEAAKPAFRVGQDATGANYEQFAAAPPVEDGLEAKCAR